MNYIVRKMSKEELYAFLDLFSLQILCNPIVKCPKHYQKFINGFRTTNIQKHLLYKIYYNEIHSGLNNHLENFLISNSKFNFANTRIEELVDNTTQENLLKVASELECEILRTKLTISPSQVYRLAGYDLSEKQVIVMDSYCRVAVLILSNPLN